MKVEYVLLQGDVLSSDMGARSVDNTGASVVAADAAEHRVAVEAVAFHSNDVVAASGAFDHRVYICTM
jgi:hypothetical protein